MSKGKIQKFEENLTFDNIFQPLYEEIISGFPLKGKWNEEYFHNSNPIVLELACGKGEYSIGLAEKYPDKNFIGIDIKGSRIWRGAKTAFDNKIKNVAFLRIQISLLEHCFDKDEVSEIWITFPDPHPRTSRYRRRLTSPNFLRKFMNIIKKDGHIHLKTDDQGLFDYTLDVIDEKGHYLLAHTRDIYKTDSFDEVKSIQTFYEKMFLEQNLPIHYLKFRL